MIKSILFIALTSLFLACGNKIKNEESEESVNNRIEKVKDSLISKTSIDYDVKNIVNGIFDKYTIDLKKLVGPDIHIIKNFKVVDIYEIGDSTFVFIQFGNRFNDYYIDLNISKLDLEEFKKNIVVRGRYDDGFLLVRLSTLKKARFSLETESDYDETSNIVLSDENVFKGRGDLIKLVLYPKGVK
jgi:hypothetical protein